MQKKLVCKHKITQNCEKNLRCEGHYIMDTKVRLCIFQL